MRHARQLPAPEPPSPWGPRLSQRVDPLASRRGRMPMPMPMPRTLRLALVLLITMAGLGMVLAMPYDDARSAAAAWGALAGTLGITGVSLLASDTAGRPAGLHPSRSAFIIRQDGTKRASVVAGDLAGSSGVVGVVGEVDPDVLEAFGISGGSRRVGWLEVDLERLLACERRSPLAKPVSRFPSSDVDLAFDVPDAVSAAEVHSVISRAAGPLLEACWLFDVYRDAARHRGSRSLAYRLRFSAADRTLTDSEVGEIRQRCVDAAERELGLRLRG